MFQEKHIPNKLPGEQLITYVRPHWVYLVKSLFLSFVMFILPIGLYFLLSKTIPQILIIDITYIILILLGCVYYLMTLLVFYNRFIDYHLDLWVVTNFRVIAIEQNNIFHRTVSEHKLDVIQDVSANQKGLFQTMLNYGDVTIQTASEKMKFHFDDVPNPFEVAKEINDLLHKQKTP